MDIDDLQPLLLRIRRYLKRSGFLFPVLLAHSYKVLRVVHQITVLADIALPAVFCAGGQMLRAMLDQILQPFSAPNVPLSVMTGKGQYHNQLQIFISRVLFQLQQ